MPYPTYQNAWNPYLPQFNQGQPLYQQPVNGTIRVNGRDSALQYQLPPNSTSPALFDNNGKVFYIVSTDGTGTKSVEVFDFSPHIEEQSVSIDGAKFVSRQEFDEFAAKVNAVIGASNGIHGPVRDDGTTGGAGRAGQGADLDR